MVVFKPNWVNGWWLRAFTDPYADVDGTETRCSWSAPTPMDASPGRHRVRAFVRYRRWIPGDGASGEATVDVSAGEDTCLTFSNGIGNQSPFMLAD